MLNILKETLNKSIYKLCKNYFMWGCAPRPQTLINELIRVFLKNEISYETKLGSYL